MPDTLTPAPAAAVAVARSPTPDSRAALLDAEKLHVYRLAVAFQTLAARLVPRQRGVLFATLRDQLDRVATLIQLRSLANAGVAPRQRRNAGSINGLQRWPQCLSCYLFK